MNFQIQFLFINCLLVIIVLTADVGTIEKAVKKFIKTQGESVSCAYKSLYFDELDYRLFLRKDRKISRNSWSLYWKAVNGDGIPLTVKINEDARDMTQEAKILEYLKAKDPNLESHGIPRIYFSGSVMGTFRANVMTLFHGSFVDVQKRYKKEKRKLSELSVLILFRGAVIALKFLSEQNVVHNNIQPENIFVYADKVFLCNFELAVGPDDAPHNSAYPPFASSNWHRTVSTGVLAPRQPMDDFESLLFSIWTVAGMRMDPSGKPEALILYQFKNRADAKSRFVGRCNYFKDTHARNAFRQLIDELISERPVPDYNNTLAILDTAISSIEAKSKPERIDWMGISGEPLSSKGSKFSKLLSGISRSFKRVTN